jgi:hypothetical protein
LPEHLDLAAPLHAELGLRATFFLKPDAVLPQIRRWQRVAEQGHEIGNGSLIGASVNGSLDRWTLRTVEQDLHMTSTFLADHFGHGTPSSVAIPGPVTTCADGCYLPVLQAMFPFVRGPAGDPVDGALPALAVRTWPDPHLEESPLSGWTIVAFGPLLVENDHAILLQRLFLEWVSRKREELWVAPLAEVGNYAKLHTMQGQVSSAEV